MARFIVLTFLATLYASAKGASTWNYVGKDNWGTQFPNFCSGQRQSPIDLPRFQNVYRHLYWPLVFENYDHLPESMTVDNNGHTVKITYQTSKVPAISHGHLYGKYLLAQFHMHWGADRSKGSEHTIQGVSYPMELHLVHWKESYGSLEKALNYGDGLAVLGIMFEQSETDNPKLEKLFSMFSQIKNPTDTPVVSTANNPATSAYLPENIKSFYRYEGGLTTPTCNEVVIWTVFKDTVKISKNQLDLLRALIDLDNKPMVDNFRSPQPLNNRKITTQII